MDGNSAVLDQGSRVAGCVSAVRRSPVALGLGGKATELATQILLVTLIPRLLGPGDYGALAIGLAVVTVGSTLITLGGPAVMARYVPAAPPAERAALARALTLRLACWCVLPLTLALAAAGTLASFLPNRFPALATALVVLALALDVAANLAFQVALGFGRAGVWSFRYPLQNVLLAIGVVVLYPLAGLDGALGALAISSTGTLIAGVAAIRGAPFRDRKARVPSGAMRFGALQGLGAALALFTQRGGVIVVALLAHPRSEVGFAALAVGVSLAATFTIGQAFTVQLPSLAERWAANAAGAEAAARRLARSSLAVVIPAAIVSAALVGSVAGGVLGNAFRGAEPAFIPALAAVVLAPVVALGQQVASLRLRADVRAWSTAAGAAVFLATALATVPVWGAEGATFALLGATAATALVSGLLLRGALPALPVAFAAAGGGAVLVVGMLA